MKKPEEAARWLRARDHFLILTHVRPDGDTTGCAIALCLGLRSLGKDAWIWENPQFSSRYLPRMEGLLRTDRAEDATMVAVDMATESLLPKGGEGFAGTFQLCIDHHPSNTFYAADTLLDASCAGCGELIYQVLAAMGVEITPEMAFSTVLTVFLIPSQTEITISLQFSQINRKGSVMISTAPWIMEPSSITAVCTTLQMPFQTLCK